MNREIKRRADVMGIFPDDDAIVRLLGAFASVLEPLVHNGSLLESNDEWAVARRYMLLETLTRVTNSATVRLPAVAA